MPRLVLENFDIQSNIMSQKSVDGLRVMKMETVFIIFI